MKISINWIKEFVNLPENLTARQLAHDLTMATVEVEDAIDLAELLNKVVAGKILEVKKHPNADRLRVVLTDLGQYGTKEIVCGGSNLEAGMFVAVSMPGAKVYWHGENKLTEIAETKLRGVKSFGMICTASEVGLANLFPQASEHEVLELKPENSIQGSVAAGQNLSEIIGYNDIIFEIDNKSLTNRPDLWGHYGLAREFAAFYKLDLKPVEFPEVKISAKPENLSVSVEDTTNCPRYTAIVINNVKNCDSPFWLKSKLSKVGNNSHGFLVDLTNYVMLTLGEPTHVFDKSKIKGSKIIVRTALDKEKIKLLDEKELSLNNSNLVIADEKDPVALAGIMGGLLSSVTSETENIIFEAANFNAVNIRKTSASHAVRTDSSSRFEKSLDPVLCTEAGRMFVSLLKSVFDDAEITAFKDVAEPLKNVPDIQIEHSFISSRLGESVSKNSIVQTLTLLGFKVAVSDNKYSVQVPSWRATGDVKIPEDIVEEIARITGYDNFPVQPVQVSLSSPVFHRIYRLEKSFKLFLTDNCGYQEIYSYPWVSGKALQVVTSNPEPDNSVGRKFICSLAEPPDKVTAFLRTSLIPGLAEAAARNLRFFDSVSLTEFGRVFDCSTPAAESANGEKLPEQNKYISAIRSGKDLQAVFLKARSDIADLFSYHNFACEFRDPEQKPGQENAGLFQERLNVYTSGQQIGFIASLSKKQKKVFDLSNAQAAVFELNFELIKTLQPDKTQYSEIPKFPGIDYDLSLLFDKKISWKDISNLIKNSDNLIENIAFIEEFYGKQIPDGKKSIVLRISLRSPERTLTSDEVAKIIDKILNNIQEKLSGELRKI